MLMFSFLKKNIKIQKNKKHKKIFQQGNQKCKKKRGNKVFFSCLVTKQLGGKNQICFAYK
jgi:hypothetical protein